jgi:hypothetical protein
LRLAGADLDNPEPRFRINAVPEVYKIFDDLSYDLSRLQLKGFAQNAMGQRMMHASADAAPFNSDPVVNTQPVPQTGGHTDPIAGARPPVKLGARPPPERPSSARPSELVGHSTV